MMERKYVCKEMCYSLALFGWDKFSKQRFSFNYQHRMSVILCTHLDWIRTFLIFL